MKRFAILLLCYAVTEAIGITSFQPPTTTTTTTHHLSSSLSSVKPLLLSSSPPPLFRSAASSVSSHRTTKRHYKTLLRVHNSDSLSSSSPYQLKQKTWMFQDKYPIAYEVASSNVHNGDDDVTVPILLLNGFGVGSFHQHRLMRQLLMEQQQQQQKKQQHCRYVIYGIDYLGQGKSWPIHPQDGNSPDEYQLGYSADMWLDQLASFVKEVILLSSTSSSNNNNKVHLVGNSVGGYLATILTYRYPSYISSLTLLNATPVWGLNLPGWDGKLPAPTMCKLIGRGLFDIIRKEDVIQQYLETAYVRREAFDGTFWDGFIVNDDDDDDDVSSSQEGGGGGGGEPLGVKIRRCTEGNGGHAAFASILWSAPASGISFYDALQQIPVDVLLLFGGDDPWCTQAVGKRMHVTLASREKRSSSSSGGGGGSSSSSGEDGGDDVAVVAAAAQRFVVLENVGHCPNHEAPSAVARVLIPWLNASDSKERSLVPLDSHAEIHEPWGDVIIREISLEESKSLGFVDRVVSNMVG